MSTIEELLTKSDEVNANLETTINFAENNVNQGNANSISVNKQVKEFVTLPQINNTDFNRGLLGLAFDATPTQTDASFVEVEMYYPSTVANPGSLPAVAELATADCYQTTSYKTVRFPLYPSKESRISETISEIALINSLKATGNLEALIAKHSKSTTYALSRVLSNKLYSGTTINF